MSDDDPELEAFLRQFRPRAPAPLEVRRPPGRWALWAAAAAASALIALWARDGRDSPAERPDQEQMATGPSVPTAALLGRAWRNGDHDRLLDALDARALPDPG